MTTIEVDIPGQWNCPKLTEAVQKVIGVPCEVSWCDRQGRLMTRKDNPRYLSVTCVNDHYREQHLRKLDGCLSVHIMGEVRMDGPNGFVIVEQEKPTFLKAIFKKAT